MPLYEIMAIATVHTTPAQLSNMLGKLAIVAHKGQTLIRCGNWRIALLVCCVDWLPRLAVKNSGGQLRTVRYCAD